MGETAPAPAFLGAGLRHTLPVLPGHLMGAVSYYRSQKAENSKFFQCENHTLLIYLLLIYPTNLSTLYYHNLPG